MYPRDRKLQNPAAVYRAAGHVGSSQSPSSTAILDVELFGSPSRIKASIVAHPLFEQLLAAHVACLRAATPAEQQHVVDSALAERHYVAAKYLALVSHLESVSEPAENQELSHFMADYILLLQSFKESLLKHLRIETSHAISSYQEIEQVLFNLTGAFSSSNHKDLFKMKNEAKNTNNEKADDGVAQLGIGSFLPYSMQKELRDHVRRGLKREFKEDYRAKLKEVCDEISRKRRDGKLLEDTMHVLKDWWISHATWPYPTKEDKVQLAEETGLHLKQINNWFIKQRKRNWQSQRNNAKGNLKSCNTGTAASSTNVSISLSLSFENGSPHAGQ